MMHGMGSEQEPEDDDEKVVTAQQAQRSRDCGPAMAGGATPQTGGLDPIVEERRNWAPDKGSPGSSRGFWPDTPLHEQLMG